MEEYWMTDQCATQLAATKFWRFSLGREIAWDTLFEGSTELFPSTMQQLIGFSTLPNATGLREYISTNLQIGSTKCL